MAKITEFEQALMHRDKMNRKQAGIQRTMARKAVNDIIANGGSYDEVEEYIASEYGLEMDYIFDIL